MDPRLLDLVWEVYQKSGSRGYINVISAYRSPATNNMLRTRGRGVAKHSQHMLGKAMDFYLTDVKLSKLREIGLKMGVGGVGFYPTSGSPFVHLDTGNVRHWPKMSRQELARLFPDGKTLHIPSDGKPLPKYDQALAEYKSKGRTSPVTVASAEETKKPGFFARLAQRAQEDQADDEGANDADAAPAAKPVVMASAAPAKKSAVPAATLEAGVNTPAPPETRTAAVPVPAAEVGAQPADVPVPTDPERPQAADGEPLEVASLEAKPQADEIPLDRIPVPMRRPQAPVLAFAAAPQPRPLDGSLVVAALTPEEIENLRRTAVPNPAAAPATPPVAANEPPMANDVAGSELALAKVAQPPAPRAVQALENMTAAQPAAAAPASPAPTGPSRKTLELALASTGQNDSEAARAIRDLVDADTPQASDDDDLGAVSLAGIPVPQPNPRKVAMAAKPATAAVAKAPAGNADPAKVSRYALASSGNLGSVRDIVAPGYAPGTQDAELVVASFRTSQAVPVTGKFAPAGNLPALTVRTN
jgi:hypothetical protein